MPPERRDLLQGTLEMLVLKTLSLEPMHGWGISVRLRESSGAVFEVQQGSLYPALQRMVRRGWIRSEWRASDNNRRARYYALTRLGEAQLGLEIAEWRRAAVAIERVLQFALTGA